MFNQIQVFLILLLAIATILAFYPESQLLKSSISEGNSVAYELFVKWKQTFAKQYSSDEEDLYRFQQFKESYDFINDFESDTVKLSLNKFSDLSSSEFQLLYTGYVRRTQERRNYVDQNLSTTSLPSSFSWKGSKYLPQVQDQLQCGGCWAFASSESLSFIYAQSKDQNVLMFSPQELIDCSYQYSNFGCNGGNAQSAFSYTQTNGITNIIDYPYLGKANSCMKKNTPRYYPNNGGYFNVQKDIQQFMAALVQRPLAVAIQADQNVFKLYQSGIITSGCGISLDHAVLAVGFTPTYAIIQNSWGNDWGDKGFVNLAFSSNLGNGACGFLIDASYPNNNN